MGLTKYQNELRDAISNGCVELLRQLLSEDLHALHTVNPVGIRDLDYLLYYSLVHNNVDEQSLELCRAVFDAGANPNVSFYNQSQVGFLVDSASRSLALTQLFVERGSRINHDLLGKPACWPLISAIAADKLDIVTYLVSQGAAINFVNIHGASPLDYARPDSEVREYLLSIGAKPGTELPKDHLPKPEYEMPQVHDSFEAFLKASFKPDSVVEIPLREIVPNQLTIRFWQLPHLGSDDTMNVVVTDGLHNLEVVIPSDELECVPYVELGMEYYPEEFPMTEEGFRNPRTRWPLEWLRRLASHPQRSGESFRSVNLISNDDPLKPLGEGTTYVGWLLRSVAGSCDIGRWKRPDGANVELLMATPLFADELAYGLKNGTDKLISKLKRGWCLDRVWADRDSVLSME